MEMAPAAITAIVEGPFYIEQKVAKDIDMHLSIDPTLVGVFAMLDVARLHQVTRPAE